MCKICKNTAKRNNTICSNTTNHMGTTWHGYIHIKKHTLPPSSWLLQLISSHSKTTKSTLNNHNQTSQRNLHRNRHTTMHHLRWWLTIHSTRVQEFHAQMGHTTQSNIPHQCAVQWPSRAVHSNYQKQPKQSHGGRRGLTSSNPLIYLYPPESQPSITSRTTEFKKISMPTTTPNRTTEPHSATQCYITAMFWMN